MRYLLLSVLVVCVIGIMIPNAFGVQYPVLIHGGVADNREMNFLPSVIEIEKGDTITWKNLERGVYHTVTHIGLFDERLINCTYWKDGIGICGSQQKSTFSYTFEEFGTYDYNCKLHSWMNGVVKVIEFGSEAEVSVDGNGGNMFIEKAWYTVTEKQPVNIKIYGKVKDPNKGNRPLLTITNPDGSIVPVNGIIKRDGSLEWYANLSVTYEETGTYNVYATFGLEDMGTANFVVVERPNPIDPNPVPPSSLTITTDFQSYEKGDKIKISGQFSRYLDHKLQLTLQMLDPQNNIVTDSQTSLNKDGTYYMSINSNGPMFRTEGDYTIKVKYGTWDASTKFFLTVPNTFNPQSPAPSTQSKTSTLLILDSIPSTFEAQGQNSQAEVIVSGKLTSSDRQYVITSAIIQLKAERWGTAITTDGKGEFSFKKNWDVGNDYGVYAVFDGTSNFEPSKSQTEYFDVRPGAFQPQPPTTPEDDIAVWNGILGLVVLIIVIVAIVIGIKGARKKRPIQYQTIGGSRQPPAPPKPKISFRIRKPKPKVQPQGIEDYDLGPLLYCPNVACRSEHLQTKANGQKYCTKCGWNK